MPNDKIMCSFQHKQNCPNLILSLSLSPSFFLSNKNDAEI